MQIEYLASYAGGMGVLEVDCVAGCSCPSDVSIDAHTPLVRASRHVLACVPVTEAPSCHMRFRVSATSSSGGYKIVLHALRVLLQPPASGRADAPQHASPGGGTGGGRIKAVSSAAEESLARWRCDASLPSKTHEYLNQ